MSSEAAKQLLQRIKPEEKPKGTYTPPEPSAAQVYLLRKIRNRKYREAMLEKMRQILQMIEQDYFDLLHFRGCGECQVELSLAITRYNGRCCPWYLNVGNESGYPEIYEEVPLYKDCPRPSDYDMGSYGRENFGETKRFILDRCNWAESKLKEMASAATVYLQQMVEWDLHGSPPVPSDKLDMYWYY